jgi:ribosomal protein S18 acetylase RimI-like enzyme
MTAAKIRSLRRDDLQEVARIHIAAFPNSALGLLGLQAVTRYYQWLLEGPHDAVSLGIFQEQGLAGFCFAGVFRGALSGFLKKNRMFLTWLVVTHPWLIATPLFRERLNLALAIVVRKRMPPPQVVIPARSFGVLSIAVDPQFQGAGLGKELLAETEKVALERGFAHMHLTVAADNFQAIAFYKRSGWQPVTATDGIWHGVLFKKLEVAGG